MSHRQTPEIILETFAAEMRARREGADLSRGRLAERLGCSPGWLAKVETLDKPPSRELAEDLDTFHQTCGTFVRMWDRYDEYRKKKLIPAGLRPLAEAEQDAVQIGVFAPVLLPGILQTEECARFILSSHNGPERTEELVKVRMDRQVILTKPEAPCLFVVIKELVLRELPAEICREQCKRLLDLNQSECVAIQLLRAKARQFYESGMSQLSFRNAADVIYVDGIGGFGQLVVDPDDVRRLAVAFNMIRSSAESVEESDELIRSIMEVPE